MKKRKENNVVYYSDPLNDDFAGTKIKQKTVDEKFKYVHKNPFWKFFSFIINYCFAIPIFWIYVKIFQNVRFKYENKKSIKKLKTSYFLYGNHTGVLDTYTPHLIAFKRRNIMVASPDAISLRGVKNVVQLLGGLPVPNSTTGLRKFTESVEYYYKKNYVITIYPEAHIWPYYTGIRPFKDTSFGYPVKFNAPVVAFVTTFKESKYRNAKRTIYISKPFFPNPNLSFKEAKTDLRNRVFDWMSETAKKYSTYCHIKYLPKQENEMADMKTDENSEI